MTWQCHLMVLLVGMMGSYPPAWAASSTVHRLEPVAVLPIDSAVPIEPSGLCLRDGRLFSVSDKTDDTIFEIVIDGDAARFVPFLKFTPPPKWLPLDFEGITTGPEGSFFIVSEMHVRVLQVFPDGRSEWVTESALDAGRAVGLFKVMNGRAEGLTRLPDGRFLLAAERQARGVITISEDGAMVPQAMTRTRFSRQLPLLRITDFTGLDNFDEKVWVLFRNADLITTLELGTDGWREGAQGWSFRSVVNHPDHAYSNMQFGQAEGLAVDERHFYVVIDNNQMARAADPTDKRPLLLILRRPDA